MSRHSAFLMGCCALAALAATSTAQASGSAAAGLQDLRALNLIVLGNMSGGHDVEGKTFVGGNLTNAATYGLGRSSEGFAVSTFPTLTVVGSLSGNANINNGPNGSIANGVVPAGATVGGSVGSINLNANNATLLVGGSIGGTNGGNGATIKAGGGLGSNPHPTGTLVQGNLGSAFTTPLVSGLNAEKATLTADLTSLSTSLAALSTTVGSSYSLAGNKLTINAADPGHLGYAVIDITVGQTAFASANDIIYNIPTVSGGGYLTTIINVSGSSSYTDNANSNGNAGYNPYVIWNFEAATSITFNRQFNGSVLAVDATISNSTPIEGSVAVAGFNQGGEIHLGTFEGVSPLPSAAPEPATWALMMAGIGLTGAALRRRRVIAVA